MLSFLRVCGLLDAFAILVGALLWLVCIPLRFLTWPLLARMGIVFW